MERSYKKWEGYEVKESEIIYHVVTDSDDYSYGQIEALAAKQNKLIEIVSKLFLRLPPEERKEFVESVSYFELMEF